MAICVQFACSGLFYVMLGLEDPFARRGGKGQDDSIHVPEICEHARRALRRIEIESEHAWDDEVVCEFDTLQRKVHGKLTNQGSNLGSQTTQRSQTIDSTNARVDATSRSAGQVRL
jgi:hypothetical protein